MSVGNGSNPELEEQRVDIHSLINHGVGIGFGTPPCRFSHPNIPIALFHIILRSVQFGIKLPIT
jgi:hypothetical protein